MKSFSRTIHLSSESAPQFIDITEQLEALIQESQIVTGIATVFSKHTTAAIRVIENEPLLINDLTKMLERLAPRES